jgi:hypothetical protein
MAKLNIEKIYEQLDKAENRNELNIAFLEIKDFVNSSRRGRRLFNSSRRAVQTQRQSMNDRLNRNRSNRNL